MKLWDWLRDEHNRAIIAMVSVGIGTLVAAGWKVYTYYDHKNGNNNLVRINESSKEVFECSASEDLKGANVNIRFNEDDKGKIVAQMEDIIINKNGIVRTEKYSAPELRETILFKSNLDKQACLLNELLFDSKYKLHQRSSWERNDNIAIYIQ